MTNRSLLVVGPKEARRTVAELLAQYWGLSQAEIRRVVRQGRVFLDGKPCHQGRRPLRVGQRLQVRFPRPEPSSDKNSHPLIAAIKIRYVDDHLLVVEKPAGLTTVRHAEERAAFGQRAGRFLPPTLVDLLPRVLAKAGVKHTGRLRAVHRLDKETSGLLVLARTPLAERHLGLQFRAHTIERRYLAIVRGRAKEECITSFLVPDRGDGRRGSTTQPGQGQQAITHVHVLEELDGFTLVECRLDTGRTHQVRIHLGEQGTPLCGERIYDRPLHGVPLPDTSGLTRPALHASFLAIDHPVTSRRLRWKSPLAKELQELVTLLRKGQRTKDKEQRTKDKRQKK